MLEAMARIAFQIYAGLLSKIMNFENPLWG
jgi:hypothetical protein